MTTFASLFRLPAAGKKFQLKFEVQIASDQTLSRVGRVFLFKNKYDMKKIVLFILLMLPVAVFGQKYTWFDKRGHACRGGEVPVEALPQMIEVAIKHGYLSKDIFK